MRVWGVCCAWRCWWPARPIRCRGNTSTRKRSTSTSTARRPSTSMRRCPRSSPCAAPTCRSTRQRGSIARTCARSSTRRSSRVASVSTSRRDGRRYVHVRLDVDDIRRWPPSPMFAWSSLSLRRGRRDRGIRAAGGRGGGPRGGRRGLDGRELVAFRLHLPSRVTFHNAPSREVLRGNIIAWEQPLADRRQGTPIDIEVRMESESILAEHAAPVRGDDPAGGSHLRALHLVHQEPRPAEPVLWRVTAAPRSGALAGL